MAFTLFGSASSPADNGTSTATQITITPPASMQVGDLVVVTCSQRGTATFSVGVAGGQAWNALTRRTNTNIAVQTFWCRFNGTWSADPRFDFSAGTNTNVQMQVFRPTSSTKAIGLEDEQGGTFAAAATITITGRTTTNASTIALATWTTADDNTWGTLTGTGWSKTSLDAQYRNTSGSDMSSTYAYRIQSSAGATNNVSQTQLTLGNDAGVYQLLTFYEFDGTTHNVSVSEAASANHTQDGTILSVPVPVGTPTSGTSPSGTSHTITLPSGIQAGELLFIFCASKNISFNSVASGQWRHNTTGTGVVAGAVYYKQADGTESGTTVTIPTGTAGAVEWIAIRVGDPNNVKKPQLLSWRRSGGTGSTSDLAAFNIGNYAKDVNVILNYAMSGTGTISSLPDGFSTVSSRTGASGEGGLHVMQRGYSLSSWANVDPGSLSFNTSLDFYSHNIVVKYYDEGYEQEPMQGNNGRKTTLQQWFSQKSLNDTNFGRGQSFKASGGAIKKVIAHILKENAAQTAGTVTCKIYAHSGTFGSSSVPTGSALATSDSINISDIPVAPNTFGYDCPVEFTFATPYQTTNNTNYVIAIEVSGNGTTYAVYAVDGYTSADEGNPCFYTAGAWASESGEAQFELLKEVAGNNVSVSETTSATHTQSATRVSPVSRSEAASAAHNQSATRISNVSVSEAANAQSNQNASKVLPVSVSESASATDNQNAVRIRPVSVSDPAAATHNQDAVRIRTASVSETANAQHTQSAGKVTNVSVSEAANAQSNQNAGKAISTSVSETANAQANQNAVFAFPVSVSETANAQENQSAVRVRSVSVSDPASATHNQSANRVSPASRTESAAANHTQSATVVSNRTVSETANAQSTQAATKIVNVSVSEAANAQANQNAALSGGGDSVSESANAQANQSAVRVTLKSVSEAANAQSNQSATIVRSVSVSEAANANDNVSSTAIRNVSVSEAANAVDNPWANYITFVSITEAANAQANQSVTLGDLVDYTKSGMIITFRRTDVVSSIIKNKVSITFKNTGIWKK